MSRRQKVSDALVELSFELSTVDTDGQATFAQVRDALIRILKGVPRKSSEVRDILALALDALEAVGAGSVSDRPAVIKATAGAIVAAARQLAGEEAGRGDLLERPADALRAALEAQSAGGRKRPPHPPEPKGPVQRVAVSPVILRDDTDIEILQEFMIESLEHVSEAESDLLGVQGDDAAEKINSIFRAFHSIKGTAVMLGLAHIQRLARMDEDILAEAREGRITITGGCTDLLLQSCDTLREMIESLEGAQPGDELSVPDGLGELLAALTSPEGGAGDGAAEERDARLTGRAPADKGAVAAPVAVEAPRMQEKRPAGAAAEVVIRVRAGKLDSLVDMVGELVIAHSMVARDCAGVEGDGDRLTRNVAHAGKIIGELQDLTMSLRMVPLRATFQKMTRLAYDLGRESGKSLKFVTEGEDTEIDRNLVESLDDPLVHMIRNAVGHGIEPAEQRRQGGKDPNGTVSLRAYHAGGHVVIEVGDDGRGLDRQKILAEAINRGLVEPGRDLSDPELFALVFEPGVSTADRTTDVSGQGVGMDVVKKVITALRGRVEVTSTPGEGCVFTLGVPLTLAVTDALVLRVGTERFLLPTASVEQSFRPERSAITTVGGKGEVVMFRGGLLPVFRLSELFGVGQAVSDPSEGLLVVVEGNGKRCALMVDELLGRQQAVIKSLGQQLGRTPGVGGAAILGDGRIGLILDAAGIWQLAHGGPGNGKDVVMAA